MPYERLRAWHDFRQRLSQLSLEQAIKESNHLWAYCPFVNHYLTIDEIEKWPGPWELIYENYYCDLARALGIVYTLYLSDHKPNIQLKIFSDANKNMLNLVYVDDGKYVCNMEFDQVVNKTLVDSDLRLVKTITPSELKLDQIQ